MKKIIFFVLATILISCAGLKNNKTDFKNQITGKWAIETMNTSLTTTDNAKEELDKFVKEMLADSYILFGNNNKYEISLMGQVNAGQWEVSKDGKRIIITIDNSKTALFVNTITQNSANISFEGKEGVVNMQLKRITN